MKLKITGVVKYKGEWKHPGDVIEEVETEIGGELVSMGVAEVIEVQDLSADNDADPADKPAKEAPKKSGKK